MYVVERGIKAKQGSVEAVVKEICHDTLRVTSD